MRGKRLTVLGLSLMLALTSLAFTATVASADSGHPNIIVQVEKFIDKADASGDNMAARYMIKIRKEGAHWRDDHGLAYLGADKGTGIYPRFVLVMGCRSEFGDWWDAARKVSKTGFRYYRGEAGNYEWLDPEDRDNPQFLNAILFDRALDGYDDTVEDLFDCVLDENVGPYWLKRLLF
jgi:hypothetical protein